MIDALPRLLSEQASRTDSRALRRWSDNELQTFADAVAEALFTVARRWSSGKRFEASFDEASTGISRRACHAEDVAELQGRSWTPAQSSSIEGPCWTVDGEPLGRLRAALFGEAAVGPSALDGARIADELAGSVWAEQCATLAAMVSNSLSEIALESTRGVVASALWQRWSGAVVVALPWCDVTLRCLFSAGAVAAVLRARGVRRSAPTRVASAPAVGPLQALAAVPACVEARLAPVDIDLGSLLSLRVGDVLRVRHALDEPVRIVAPRAPVQAEVLCLGWLGRRDDHLAVELARFPGASAR